MKREQRVLATSHRDLHNERFTKEALEKMVARINAQYVPVGVEHDPRIPPVGRIVEATLEHGEDGEYAVIGTIEQFEHGDPPPLSRERTMPIEEYEPGHYYVGYDRTFAGAEDLATLNNIAQEVGAELSQQRKKAVDPLSVLILGGGFVVGGIATGFFQKLGADLYDATKGQILSLLKRKQAAGQEHLLIFRSSIRRTDYVVAVEAIITNPDDNDLEFMYERGLAHLDALVPALLEQHPDARRFVFEYSNGSLTLSFIVRSDAVPYLPEPDTSPWTG